MRILENIINIWRQQGLKSLTVQSIRFLEKQIYWRYFFARRSVLCDFDTSKITRVKLDPSIIQYRVSIVPEYVPRYGSEAIGGELTGKWDRLWKPSVLV